MYKTGKFCTNLVPKFENIITEEELRDLDLCREEKRLELNLI